MIGKTLTDTVQGQTRPWKSCSPDLKTYLSPYSSGSFLFAYYFPMLITSSNFQQCLGSFHLILDIFLKKNKDGSNQETSVNAIKHKMLMAIAELTSAN